VALCIWIDPNGTLVPIEVPAVRGYLGRCAGARDALGRQISGFNSRPVHDARIAFIAIRHSDRRTVGSWLTSATRTSGT
jgi:hypothetical protein